MKLCYFLTDRHGPGNLRCLIPGRALQEKYDWEFTSHNTMSVVANHLLLRADIYVMARQTHQALPIVVDDMVRLQGECVIGEVDDLFLGISSHHKIHKNAIDSYYTVQPKILGACSAMTVSTPELEEAYRRINPNIRTIRNRLDWEMWRYVELEPDDRFRVGWMGGTSVHIRDLAVLSGVIGPWIEQHPDAVFVAAGDKKAHPLLRIPERQRMSYPTVPYDQLNLITPTMDVGLVPLELGRFNEAKSSLKGMEYGACGIPCIASPTSEYERWVDHGTNGWLVYKNRPQQWIRWLDESYQLWKSGGLKLMGEAARKKAELNSIQYHISEWYDFYMEQFERTRAEHPVPVSSPLEAARYHLD